MLGGSGCSTRRLRIGGTYGGSNLGHVLDVGCGIGRNLGHLDGNGVGVDLSPTSIAEARARGFTAYTAEEFPTCPDAKPERYDSLLFAHVLEHMTQAEASDLVGSYLPYLRPGGQVVIIVPQEAGFASDPTHVEFVDRACDQGHRGSPQSRVGTDLLVPVPPGRGQDVPPQRDDRHLTQAVSWPYGAPK